MSSPSVSVLSCRLPEFSGPRIDAWCLEEGACCDGVGREAGESVCMALRPKGPLVYLSVSWPVSLIVFTGRRLVQVVSGSDWTSCAVTVQASWWLNDTLGSINAVFEVCDSGISGAQFTRSWI